MATRLYELSASPNCMKVRVAAAEAGIDLEVHQVDIFKGAGQQPDFLRMNPNGKVPTLDDNGFHLWESAAIMAYLADKKPEKGLYPTGAQERAQVNKWLQWNAGSFELACIALIWNNVVKPMFLKQEPDAVVVAQAQKDFAKHAATLNGALEGKDYVANNQFSVADIAMASVLMYRQPAQMDTSAYPHLERWLARVESRPSWAASAPKM